MKLRLSLLLNALLCCAAVYAGAKWHAAEQKLEQISLNSGSAAPQRSPREPAASPAAAPNVLPGAAPAQVTEAAPSLSAAKKAQTRGKVAGSLLAPGLVKSVSSHVSLTAEQEENLRERFKEETPGSAAERDAIIADVLGEETAAKYRAAREERERKEEAEEIDREVFTLSRKLSLTNRQEEQLRLALKDVRNALRPLYQEVRVRSEEAVALHSAGDEARETLRERYADMRQRISDLRTQERELLNETLRPVLNDAQMNTLLEYQADAGEFGG